MDTHEIVDRFRSHFERAGHLALPSAPLVADDPTLLFVNAGMVPFKPYFLGLRTPPSARITSLQKVVRTGDIDNVGHTTRHNTFFQMAGNFSFGDYFRREAIELAWRLLTTPLPGGGYGLDPGRLWVTVYAGDEETAALWREIADLPDERIQRRGRADNYWSMGVPGPCGPCSEIFYDRGPAYGRDGGPEVDEDRFLEVWNLVFMQDVRGPGTGKDDFAIVGSLPSRNIDTGLGVERLACVLQDVDNVYETDLVRPMIERTAALTGRRYGEDPADDVRFRVIADHARCATMIISDGVVPGNEGRGYVLRRLLRRIVRSARLLGVGEPVLSALTAEVRDAMAPSYPELATGFARIESVVAGEETAFLATLAGGARLFDLAMRQTREAGGTVLAGERVFQLHDTYGFPVDLTREMAAEQGLDVDDTGFRTLMAEQRDRAKAATRARRSGYADAALYRDLLAHGPTEFTGYDTLSSAATVLAVIRDGSRTPAAGPGETVEVVLNRSPLYAESGGQESDAGTIEGDALEAEVLGVRKVDRRLWVHRVRVHRGELRPGLDVLARVDPGWRLGARQAHSGTHILHAALRQVLGPEALQSGSANRPGYLRLDFAWPQRLSAATLSEVEDVCNRAIRDDRPVVVRFTGLDEARRQGALALFGETYDETVRVVEIGAPWSVELCGGTHVEHASQVGLLAVTSESSVGSGLRRVEARVGLEAFHELVGERSRLRAAADQLHVSSAELPGRVAALTTRLRAAEKELAGLRAGRAQDLARTLAAEAVRTAAPGGTAVCATTVPAGLDGGALRRLASDIRDRLGDRPGVVALFSPDENRVAFAVATTGAARRMGADAASLLRGFAGELGGRGGGSAELAQGAGHDATAVPQVVRTLRSALGG